MASQETTKIFSYKLSNEGKNNKSYEIGSLDLGIKISLEDIKKYCGNDTIHVRPSYNKVNHIIVKKNDKKKQ